MPFASTVHDIATAVTGNNYVTGQRVSGGERMLAGAGAILPVSRAQVRAATQGVQGVYHFVAASGKEYIGRSKNIWSRISRHLKSEKLPTDNLGTVTHRKVDGGTEALRAAEQADIDAADGIAGGKLDNKRNEVRKP